MRTTMTHVHVYNVHEYADGDIRWEIKCTTCDYIQPGEYDPAESDTF